jgi:Dolichyl-phosphate-mannose-protein mannosyltransferase
MKNRYGTFPEALLFIALGAVILACQKIGSPGLYYDEMLFSNAALGGRSNSFIGLRIWGVPILLMKYMGALKSWIYYPVFLLFPVNSSTIRLPAILIGIAGGGWLVLALWRGFGRPAAISGAILILFDPTLLMQSRLDWGPNAIMFFFRGLLVFSLVSWIKTGNLKWAWVALAAGALGIFDKLNFIWIAAAAASSLFLIYFNFLRTIARHRSRAAIVLATLAIVGLTVAIRHAVKVTAPAEMTWVERIPYALNLLRLTFCGGGALDFVCGQGLRLERWVWPGYILVILACCLGSPYLFKKEAEKRLFLWGILFLLLITLAFIVTRTAAGSHHSSVISGIWQFTLAPLLGAAWSDRKQFLRTFAVAGAIFVTFIGYVTANLISIGEFSRPLNNNWDPANTEAAIFARDRQDDYFLCSDWGIGNQAIAVTKAHIQLWDGGFSFSRQDSASRVIREMKRDHDTYIFTRLPEFENFKGNRNRLILALRDEHIGHEVVRTYRNWKGDPMIEIWKIPAVK